MSYATAKRPYLHSERLRRKRNEYEELYMIFSEDIPGKPSELGSEQFYDYESFGKKPWMGREDPYYLRLCQGKKWFSVQQEMIRDTYLTFEWEGWYSYWLDWKGQRWVLKYLMQWHPNPPGWLFMEDDDQVEKTIDEINYGELMMTFPPEDNPPKCTWCNDTKVIYGETPGRTQGETCPMCE